MNPSPSGQAERAVPALVPVLLAELAALRRRGDIAPAKFEAQLRRIHAEELTPRALALHTSEANGRITFTIKTTRGTVRETFEFLGKAEECPEAAQPQYA